MTYEECWWRTAARRLEISQCRYKSDGSPVNDIAAPRQAFCRSLSRLGQMFAGQGGLPALPYATIMSRPTPTSTARREFLKLLAASPYVAALGGVTAFRERGTFAQNTQPGSDVITNPASALDVLDFEEAAHRKVMAAHWANMASGVDDDATLRANRDGYKHVQLRPRRLRDATKVDMHVDLFGATYNSPIFLCPTGGEKSFFADGELSVARAAKARGTLQFLSTATSTPLEAVIKERGQPVWYQLYATTSWDVNEKILRRVEAAGCPVVALTVD